MAKVILKESPINGIGMFALMDLKKGHPILRIDDSRVVTEDDPLCEGEHEHHCDWLAQGMVVLMRPPERHINHSCDPNSFARTINGARYVFALSDIAAGDEITYDYCINGFGDTIWQCHCGSERCREEIHSDFFHLPHRLQLEYLPLLDGWYVCEYSAQVEELLRAALAL